jgi:hypothetical protein
LALVFGATTVHAGLLGIELGLPDILSNNTGTYTYNAGSNLFTVEADPVDITFDGSTKINIGDPTTANGGVKEFSLSFYVDESGNFTGGVSGDDLEIYGSFTIGSDTYDGLLLAGKVTDFGFFDLPGDPSAVFDATFDVTDGLLSSFYGDTGGGIKIFAEASSFIDDWNVNHGGSKVKSDTAPVPIATSFLIFGSGAIGLVGFWRRFSR